MPTGIEEAVAACVAEIADIAVEVLSIGSELTKQVKPDYNKNSLQANQSPAIKQNIPVISKR